uniref:Uncharacterized protein n=1 Tax=Palpitomonas bilix TaxID=652834 RepID=A0A7S3D1W7_9EUKA
MDSMLFLEAGQATIPEEASSMVIRASPLRNMSIRSEPEKNVSQFQSIEKTPSLFDRVDGMLPQIEESEGSSERGGEGEDGVERRSKKDATNECSMELKSADMIANMDSQVLTRHDSNSKSEKKFAISNKPAEIIPAPTMADVVDHDEGRSEVGEDAKTVGGGIRDDFDIGSKSITSAQGYRRRKMSRSGYPRSDADEQSADDQMTGFSGMTGARSEVFKRAGRLKRVRKIMSNFHLKTRGVQLNIFLVCLILGIVVASFTVFWILETSMAKYGQSLDQLAAIGRTMSSSGLLSYYVMAIFRVYRNSSEWDSSFNGGPATHLPLSNLTALINENAHHLRDAIVNFNDFALSTGQTDTDAFDRLHHLEVPITVPTNDEDFERRYEVVKMYDFMLNLASESISITVLPRVEDIIDSTHARFVLDNWHIARHAGELVEDAAVATLEVSIMAAIVTQIILFVLEVSLLTIAIFILRRVFIKRVIDERQRLFSLFQQIPKAASTSAMETLTLAMCNEASDESGVDEGKQEGGEQPTGGGGEGEAKRNEGQQGETLPRKDTRRGSLIASKSGAVAGGGISENADFAQSRVHRLSNNAKVHPSLSHDEARQGENGDNKRLFTSAKRAYSHGDERIREGDNRSGAHCTW